MKARLTLLACTTTSLMIWTAPAVAQPGAGSSHNAGAQALPPGTLEDIIVTAQRRAEIAQKTPLAIQVVSADSLIRAGVTEPKDLGRLVPGMQVGTAIGGAFIFIRGIGDASSAQTTNPGVSFNVDGVNLSRPDGNGLMFYDLERIEVLKGPQGTLYGRNAIGGAVNLISRRPSLTTPGGYATVEIGNYGNQHFTGAANVPVSDSFALRGAVDIVDRSGYLSDGSDDDIHQAGRISALFQPSPAFSIVARADYARQRGKGSGSVLFPRPAGSSDFLSSVDPAAIAFVAAQPPFGAAQAFGDPRIGTQGLSAAFTMPPKKALEIWGVSSEITYDFGGVNLTFLPAYRKMTTFSRSYLAWQDTHDGDARQFSSELRLAGDSATFKWLAGLFYFNEVVNGTTLIDRGNQLTNQTVDINDSQSYAAFAQGTYSLTDALRVTGGLRYTRDKRQLRGQAFSNIVAGPPPGMPAVIPNNFSGRMSIGEVTWRAGVEYDVAPNSMMFFNASRGFKSGGINSEPAPNTYKPEFLTAFEFGWRNRLFDNRLQLNLEVFRWKYDDHQEGGVAIDNTGLPNFLVSNAGAATLKGFNVDIVAHPNARNTLRTIVEYNDAKYDSFLMTQPFFGQAPVTGCRVGAPVFGAPGAIPTVDIDCAGFQLARTPKWSASGSWEHVMPLANGGEISAIGSIEYVASRWGSIDFISITRFGDYVTGDATLTYTAPRQAWSLSAFVRNIANEAIATSTYIGAQPSVAIRSVNAPRTYGARFTVNF